MATPRASIAFFILAALLGAVGQFLYKSGADRTDHSWASYLLNARLWGGVVCYIAVMVLFVAAFKRGGSLSVLYPIYASKFIWAALISRAAYGTPIAVPNLAGMGLLILGMYLLGEVMTAAPYQPIERRPIAARDLRVMHQICEVLVRWGISPNTISVLGIVASVLAGVTFWSTSWPSVVELPVAARLAWFAGGLLVQMRLLTNLFDGMVAIASGKASPLGELYNEVPDRISDAATFIGLGYAAGSSPTLGYLAALAAVFTAYVRVMAKVAGGAQDYCGPLAKQQRIFVVTLCAGYLALAPQEWQPDWNGWQLPALTLAFLVIGTLLTAARRLVRVASILQR